MPNPTLFRLSGMAIALVSTMATSLAQPVSGSANWQAGVVLDTAGTSRGLELGARDKGLGLGHSDLLLRGAFN